MRFTGSLSFFQVVAFGCAALGGSMAVTADHPWHPPGTVEITQSVVAFIQGDAGSEKDRTTYGNAILGAFSSLEKAEHVVIERVQALGGLLGKVLAESNQLSPEQMRQLQEACERVAAAQEQAARAYERFPAAATAAIHGAAFDDNETAKGALDAMLAAYRLSFAAAWQRADAAMHQRMADLLEGARTSVAPDLVISQLARPRIEANARKERIEAAFKRGERVAP